MRTSIGLVMLGIVGCGGGDGGGGSIQIGELGGEFERAFCEGQVACGAYPDLDTCLEVSLADEEFAYLEAAVAAGTVTYDGENAAECLDFFRGLTCRISQGFDDEAVEATCGGVFVGQVPEGGVCLHDEECADGGECEIIDCPDACCEGSCIPGSGGGGTIPIGGDCTEAECVSGAYCKNDFTNGTAVCEAVVADGGECSDWDACAEGLWCAGFDFDGTPGTCAAPPDRGESCADFGLCDRSDDFCDMNDFICKARRQPGESCTIDSDECVNYAVCVEAVCTALPGEGGDCSVVEECLGDLDCVSGACAAPTAEPPCDPPAP